MMRLHRLAVFAVLALLAAGCVERMEYHHISDDVSSFPDNRRGDGQGDANLDDLSSDTVLPDLPDGAADLPDGTGDLPDQLEPDLPDGAEVDAAADWVADQDGACQPDCVGRECGDDGCGGECWQKDAEVCDDGNPCTADSCDTDEYQCTHTPLDEGECDDGNPCTETGTCVAGECQAVWKELGDIESIEECICTEDGECQALDPDLCDAASFACSKEEEEETGLCVDAVVEPLVCNDGNDCTIDTCDAALGCQAEASDALCDDDNPCTQDSCLLESGCQNVSLSGDECDDGDACTENTHCDDGECLGSVVDCIDSVECTEDSCDPESGCINAPNDTLCDDGDPCTDDLCDSEQGCVHDFNTVSCNDENICTEDDLCSEGECVGTPVTCDDEVGCTVDTCDTESGCINAPNDTLCDDGNPCTQDTCDPANGCVHDEAALNSTPCNDGDPCTVGDSCQGGTCMPGTQVALACLDLDHDGLTDDVDSCPLSFDPTPLDLDGNQLPDACEPLAIDAQYMRPIAFTANGVAPVHRRTHEPVEIPLTNGYFDYSVFGYSPLDGNLDMPDSGGDGGEGKTIGTTPAEGVWGGEGTALAFNGISDYGLFEMAMFASEGTICLWLKTIQDTPFAFGKKGIDGKEMVFSYDPGSGEYKVTMALSSAVRLVATSSPTMGALADGNWHLVCTSWDTQTSRVAFTLDGWRHGQTYASQDSFSLEDVLFTKWYLGAMNDEAAGEPVLHFGGIMDELLAFSRELSIQEIRAYYESGAPYGTVLVPGAQQDFDDIRITELPPVEMGLGESVKRSRIIGVHPHSDTICPDVGLQSMDTPHRDDLCGVFGYWPLGNEGEDLTGQQNTLPMGNGMGLERGRFGDEGGATWFGGDNGHYEIQPPPQSTPIADSDITLEAWLFLPMENDEMGGTFLRRLTDNGQPIFSLAAEETSIVCILRTNAGQATVTADRQMTRWQHVACRYNGSEASLFLDGNKVMSKPLSGSLLQSNQPITLGAGGEDAPFRGVLDDVLIHAVAKSEDYLLHRNVPAIPVVRFLASTVDEADNIGSYPTFDYLLRWGDIDAQQRLPFVSSPDGGDPCYGLLNTCTGYVGWWRFEEEGGNVARDSAVNQRVAVAETGIGRAGSDGGLAAYFDGSKAYAVAYGQYLDLAQFTIETTTLLTGSGTLVSKGWAAEPETHNYGLGFSQTSNFKGFFEYDQGENLELWSTAGLGLGQWGTAAFTFDGTTVALFRNGVPDNEVDSEHQPGTNPRNLVLGGDTTGGGQLQAGFNGLADSIRIMNRGLEVDEQLHFPRLRSSLGEYLEADGNPLDSDDDGVDDDGDHSGILGDHPCTGGQTANCDDNAPGVANGNQEDADADGIGDVIDNCLGLHNPKQTDENGNGIGDLCDPTYTTDWDHDGLGLEDPCPFAFDGEHLDLDNNGQADACETKDGYYPFQANIGAYDPTGVSHHRRTHEPVEYPLQNGFIDASVTAWLPLDGTNNINDSAIHDLSVSSHNTSTTAGAFNDPGGAIHFTGNDSWVLIDDDPVLDDGNHFTAAIWFRATQWNPGGETRHRLMYRLQFEGQSDLFTLDIDDGALRATLTMMGGDYAEAVSEPLIGLYEWHHAAMTFDGYALRLFLDGRTVATGTHLHDSGLPLSNSFVADSDRPISIGAHYLYQGGLPDFTLEDLHFRGDLDDALLLSRALTPEELLDYVKTRAPYGSSVVPGSQADYDDVRVMEHPYDWEPGESYIKRSRVIGVHPHSDSACPLPVPSNTLPHREDLCEVAGYWPLDGNGGEVTQGPNSPLNALPGGELTQNVHGRFGNLDGAMRVPSRLSNMGVPDNDAIDFGTGSMTMELWFREAEPLGSVLHPICKKGTNDVKGYQLSYSLSGGIATCEFFGGSGKTVVVPAPAEHGIMDNAWHHLACVFDRDGPADIVTLYIDGLPIASQDVTSLAMGSLTNASPLKLGWANNNNPTSFEMDEVLLHSVAKSADYIYHRARPGLPKMRFLANTVIENQGSEQNPSYPMRNYEFLWGKEGETMKTPMISPLGGGKTCYGLLNPCMGYAAWWRLTEGMGALVFDQAQGKVNGELTGDIHWTAGAAGERYGLFNNGTDGAVQVEDQVPLHVDNGTFEVIFRPAATIQGASATDHPLFSKDQSPGQMDDYTVQISQTSGTLRYYVEAQQGGTAAIFSNKNTWPSDFDNHIAVLCGEEGMGMTVNYQLEPATNPLTAAFGGASATLFLGAVDAAQQSFHGTFSGFRLMSRRLTPDEMLHAPPLRCSEWNQN